MEIGKSLKFCIAFITLCAATVGTLNIFTGNLAMGIILVVMAAIVDGTYFALRNSEHQKELGFFVVISAVVIISVTQIVSRDMEFVVPMLMVAASLSALFYDVKLVRISFGLALLMYGIQFLINSLQAGETAVPVLRFLESLTAIFVCGILVDRSSSAISRYVRQVSEKQDETTSVLKDLDSKNQETSEMLGKQQNLVQQIGVVAAQLTVTSDNLSEQAENLAAGSGFQAEAMIRLTESIESVKTLVTDTDGQAQHVRDALKSMESEIIEGDRSMENMVQAVSDIDHNMQNIEKIIKSINDIAFQTNLLALNASVEAARAGSAGKGFTVVAGEVRNLAQRSADAVKDTIRVLDDCRNAVNRGNRVADETAEKLTAIKVHAGDVTRIAYDISQMTNSQRNELNKVSEDVNAVTDEIQKTADIANEGTSVVKELSEQAGRLQSLSR